MAATKLTPAQRSQSARLAALSRWANEDPVAGTAKARRAAAARFEHQVDPDGELPPAERARRAAAAQRAHMVRMNLASSRSRGRRS